MMMRFTSAAGCLILLVLMSGCTYDDLETIGSPVDCDVFDVSYGQDILPLVADHVRAVTREARRPPGLPLRSTPTSPCLPRPCWIEWTESLVMIC